MDEQEQKEESNPKEGVALALSFLTVSVFLYFQPTYLGSTIITSLTMIGCSVVGIIGLGIEINRMTKRKIGFGVDNIGIGIALIVLELVAGHFIGGSPALIVILFLLLIGVYAVILGLINIFNSISSQQEDGLKKAFFKMPIIVIQLAAFTGTILAIVKTLSDLKIINK